MTGIVSIVSSKRKSPFSGAFFSLKIQEFLGLFFAKQEQNICDQKSLVPGRTGRTVRRKQTATKALLDANTGGVPLYPLYMRKF